MGKIIFIVILLLMSIYAVRGVMVSKFYKNNIKIHIGVLMFFLVFEFMWVYFALYMYPIKAETYSEKVKQKDLYVSHCGKVTKKIEGFEKDSDGSSKYNEMLVIHYNDGQVERKDVSRKTFDSYKVGGTVCFLEDTSWSKWHDIICFILFLFMAVGIWVNIVHIFDIEIS